MKLAYLSCPCLERPFALRILSGPREKLIGLIGSRDNAYPVLLEKCSSIHTFGMKRAIDIAFIGPTGRVLRTLRNVRRRRFVSHPDAACVLERIVSSEPWLEDGEKIRITPYRYALRKEIEHGSI